MRKASKGRQAIAQGNALGKLASRATGVTGKWFEMVAFCAPKGYWLIVCDEANLKYAGSLVCGETNEAISPLSAPYPA